MSPPAPPESVPPVSSGGDALAASAAPAQANLPSAGHGLDSPAPRPAAPAALASLGATAALASLLWLCRRA
jgi:hypothetical protein